MLGVLYRRVSMSFLCLELMSKSNGGLGMSDKRYWKVKGKKVNVTNKEHDTLRNSQKQMWRIINESAGQESLEDLQERDLLDSRLANGSSGILLPMEEAILIHEVIQESMKDLTYRERYLIHEMLVMQTPALEIAKREGRHAQTIIREKNRALNKMKKRLEEIGIHSADEFF